ncbi:MAG: hypothetical protein HY898_03105 [Deltaproteobacteria bacterium]|nr:hypothetical protein [Deltaproteobacteria bacterium]
MHACSRFAVIALASAMVFGAPSYLQAATGRTVYFTPVGKAGPIRLQVRLTTRRDPETRPLNFDGWVAPGQSIAVYDGTPCIWFRHTYGVLRRVNWSDWISVCQPPSAFLPARDVRVFVPTDRPYNVQP